MKGPHFAGAAPSLSSGSPLAESHQQGAPAPVTTPCLCPFVRPAAQQACLPPGIAEAQPAWHPVCVCPHLPQEAFPPES